MNVPFREVYSEGRARLGFYRANGDSRNSGKVASLGGVDVRHRRRIDAREALPRTGVAFGPPNRRVNPGVWL